MISRPKTVQFLAILIAAGSVAGAATIRISLSRLRREHELVVPGSISALGRPELALLTMAPGGLRAPIVNYLWIAARKMQDEGRIFDAMQRASLICRFQPRFAAVWDFQAWNMAWNISVATHTPDERWLWVTNGLRLLRDEGIPYNPKSLSLYRSLAWLFFSKMGGTTDLMHLTYKRRWAREMQHLLSTPPYGGAAEAIEAFRPVAEAPLDKDPHRYRGWGVIQSNKRKELLQDPQVARYAELLAARGLKVDHKLVEAYSRYSRDDSAEFYRGPPKIETDEDRALLELFNSPEHAAARKKLLGFIRAQVLWGYYKMDPQWMLELMEKYGPLDWRLTVSHALYWATYGIHICESLPLRDIDSLNTDRLVLYCLKDLTYNGRLTLFSDRNAPDSVLYATISDPRFVEKTHEEYIRFMKALTKEGEEIFKKNILRDGHIGYVSQAVQGLYALGAKKKAQHYFDWLKTTYELKDREWANNYVEDFVRDRLRQSDSLSMGVAMNQLSLSLASAYASLARNDREGFNTSRSYAILVHKIYHEGGGPQRKGAPKRSRLPAFHELERGVLGGLLVRPPVFGMRIDLLDRGELYGRLPSRSQLEIYDWIEPPLRRQCADQKLDFIKVFPPPPGLERYRRQRKQQFVPPGI